MIELYVYNRSGTIIGEISEYESLEIEKNFYEVSKVVLRAHKSAFNIDLLRVGNIIADKREMEYGYIIEHFSSVTEEGVELIEVYAYSLNWLLSFRTIPRQMRFSGDVVRVIERFVTYTAINVESNKVIPNLNIDANETVGFFIDSSQTGGSVLNHVLAIAKEAECTVDILLRNGLFYLKVHKGLDRSISQNVNDTVVFSKELDNVLSQEYFESYLDFKNVAVVAGEGEGVNRTISEVNSNQFSGLDRREIYIDARDLRKTYTNENNVEITLTDLEYEAILQQRGLQELRKYNSIKNFQSTIDDVQYRLGIDYFLGDKVSFLDMELGVVLDSTITKIQTTSNINGVSVKPTFGESVLTSNRRMEV